MDKKFLHSIALEVTTHTLKELQYGHKPQKIINTIETILNVNQIDEQIIQRLKLERLIPNIINLYKECVKKKPQENLTSILESNKFLSYISEQAFNRIEFDTIFIKASGKEQIQLLKKVPMTDLQFDFTLNDMYKNMLGSRAELFRIIRTYSPTVLNGHKLTPLEIVSKAEEFIQKGGTFSNTTPLHKQIATIFNIPENQAKYIVNRNKFLQVFIEYVTSNFDNSIPKDKFYNKIVKSYQDHLKSRNINTDQINTISNHIDLKSTFNSLYDFIEKLKDNPNRDYILQSNELLSNIIDSQVMANKTQSM